MNKEKEKRHIIDSLLEYLVLSKYLATERNLSVGIDYSEDFRRIYHSKSSDKLVEESFKLITNIQNDIQQL